MKEKKKKTEFMKEQVREFRWHRMIHMGMHVRVSEVP
jgi:hypothetical protein